MHVIYTHIVIFMSLLCSTMSYKTHIPPRHVCCNDAEIAIGWWRHGRDKNGFYDAPRLRLLYFIRTWRRSGSWLQSARAFQSYNNIILCLYLYYHRRNGRENIARSLQWREEWWMTELIIENELWMKTYSFSKIF